MAAEPAPDPLPAGWRPPGPALPIDEVLDEVVTALDAHGRLVLEAPPGAGKTTRVPLAWLARGQAGRLLVLEPRRVAARAAAARLAAQLGEEVGRRVGLTTRDERRTSVATRIEVVTEGVLLRRLQRDPVLPGTAALLFDEFHERSLEADLALAFALEARAALRPDLEVLVASAPLDGARIATLLHEAPVVRAEGRRYPVEVSHRERPTPGDLERRTADAVVAALADGEGDVLVFLPGVREIRRTAEALLGRMDPQVRVLPLHGRLPAAEQDAALRPPGDGRRRVVLATDLAESSVTIEGVRTVVDAGLSREPRYDPTTGLSGLVTRPASRASAEQRAGRAGRLAPGRCIRLWPSREHPARDAASRPAIASDDLTGAALEVAAWGADLADLALLDAPPPRAWAAARETLAMLGALDAAGRITLRGRSLVSLPLHPRLGTLLLAAAEAGEPHLGAELAALLADRDPVRPGRDTPDHDLATRLRVLRGDPPPAGVTLLRGPLQRARRERDRLLARLGASAARPGPLDRAGALVLAGWPELLAQARSGRRGGYLLASGRGAELPPGDPLAGAAYLAVAHLDRGAEVARIHLAAAVDEQQVREVLGARIDEVPEVAWRDGDVVAERREELGSLVLSRAPLADAPDQQRLAALLDGLRADGLGLLDVRPADRQLQARAAFVAGVLAEPWPPLDDVALLAEVDATIAPFLLAGRTRADLARQRLGPILEARLGHDRLRRLDRLAPTQLTVPSGSRRPVDYLAGDRPVLAVRLQELFGATATPMLVDGRVPVLLHLLSPAGRPVQVTDDLAGFWVRGYPEVRAQLRGRYPKHAWPEDPVAAAPLRGTPRRRR